MAREPGDFDAPTVVSPTNLWSLEAPEPKPATLVGAVLGGRYRLLREIGPLPEELAEGKAVTMFAGEHSELGHTVQVKVFGCADEQIGDVVARARAQGQVATAEPLGSAPCVSRVIDLGLQFGVGPYLVFRAHGTDLASALASTDRPGVADLAFVTLQISWLLETCHGAGLVYGTICPQNVFVDKTWRVQLGPPMARPNALTSAHDVRALGKLLEALVNLLLGEPSPESARIEAMEKLAQSLCDPDGRLDLGQAVQRLLAICPEAATRLGASIFLPGPTRRRGVLRRTLVLAVSGCLLVIAFVLGALVGKRATGLPIAPASSPQYLNTAAPSASIPAPTPAAAAATQLSPEATSAGSRAAAATGVGEDARAERTGNKTAAGTEVQKSAAPATTAKTPTSASLKPAGETGAAGSATSKGNTSGASRSAKPAVKGLVPW